MSEERNEIIDTFRRVEDKYAMTPAQAEMFLQKCRSHIKEDVYFRYTVQSIYYDTIGSDLIIQSLLKPEYKMKLRLRSYGQPDGTKPVFLETKKKYKNIVYKRRIVLGEKEADDYLEFGIPHHVHNNTADEIDYIMNFYNPEAKVLIAYDRECYSSTTENDVRITLDTNIRYRTDHVTLYEDGSEKKLAEGVVMLEVKAMDRYPMWLGRILSEMNLRRTSFSKYGTIYSMDHRPEAVHTASQNTYAALNYRKENPLCSVQY